MMIPEEELSILTVYSLVESLPSEFVAQEEEVSSTTLPSKQDSSSAGSASPGPFIFGGEGNGSARASTFFAQQPPLPPRTVS